MKKIIYTRADGGVSVVTPSEGARLANSVTLNGETIGGGPKAVDRFFRRWPVLGAVADWAETEDQFYERIKNKDVPAAYIASAVIVDPSVIPTDRSKRNAWRQIGSTIVLDPTVSTQIDSHATRCATDESERVACSADSTIMGLVNQTRAEWLTWAGANFPTLTAAEKQRLGVLFWVVSVGARRLIRSS